MTFVLWAMTTISFFSIVSVFINIFRIGKSRGVVTGALVVGNVIGMLFQLAMTITLWLCR